MTDLRRFPTANDLVYHYVRRWIVSGELRPGEKLDQEDIATRLDASRMPVRTAFERLASGGLVVMTPHRGARVADMSVQDMLDVYDIRLQLEPWALKLAAGKLTGADAAKCRYFITETQKALDGHDWNLYIDHNYDFYKVLWAASGNAALEQLLDQLSGRALRYRWLYVEADGSRSLKTMKSVLDGIVAGDSPGVFDSFHAAISSARDQLADLITAKTMQARR